MRDVSFFADEPHSVRAKAPKGLETDRQEIVTGTVVVTDAGFEVLAGSTPAGISGVPNCRGPIGTT